MRETIFSPCTWPDSKCDHGNDCHYRKYRYTLWRQFEVSFDMFDGCNDGERGYNPDAYVQFIGLNPSTADETNDDPTIRRCINFAKYWGFRALCMTNIFAWRDTLPESMKLAAEPIGPDNDKWLLEIAKNAGLVIAAWGKHGLFMNRGLAVKAMFNKAGIKVHCLRQNADGSPQHPLYLPGNLKPIPFD